MNMFLNILLPILIIPGLACFYAIILRPLLHKIPKFQRFYTEADGFWEKVWALCGNSLTILWGYLIGGFGSMLQVMDWLAQIFGDPDLDMKTKVTDLLKDHPQYAAYALMAISGITVASRLRSIVKG